MSAPSRSNKGALVALSVVLVLVAGGFGYYYATTTSALQSDKATQNSLSGQVNSLQANLTQLQNLISARDSIKILRWLGSQSGNTNTYQVKITNNNKFDVTLQQLTVSVVDTTGAQVASNTISSQIVVSAGNSVTTGISVNFPFNGSGVSVQAILITPFGRVLVGSI